jgi:hypothetical protein
MLLTSALFVPAFGDAGSAQQVRSEKLVGGNENPPVISDGSGTFRARVRDGGADFRLKYNVASEEDAEEEDGDAEEEGAEEEVDGLLSDVIQAHLHIANPGQNGGIVVFLCTNLGNTPMGATVRECPESPGVVRGEIVAADVQEVPGIIEAGDLDGLLILARQGSVYVNVHSDDHTGGEIRGQVGSRRR